MGKLNLYVHLTQSGVYVQFWPSKYHVRIRLKMILPKLKISHSKYFSWHLSASQATITGSGADTARAWAWVWNMRRDSHWLVRGLRLLSALSSWLQNASVCEKLYQSWEAWPGRGAREALAALEKWRGVVMCSGSQASQAVVVLLAPKLQQHHSGCVAQLFHCGSVVKSCYVATARFFLATKN